MTSLPTFNQDTYSTAKKESLIDKVTLAMRKKIYARLARQIDLDALESVIDVGVTADRAQLSSNFFEALYPHPERITAFSNQDARWMEGVYKGLAFRQGTALAMPFADNTFDLVFSSAVIEHVGSADNQRTFISECFRIAKRHVFITTPNRHYPIELHTALPLLHWFPKRTHRKILRCIGKPFFAQEDNLNLLTSRELAIFCTDSGISRYAISSVSLLGFPSNLLLMIEKA